MYKVRAEHLRSSTDKHREAKLGPYGRVVTRESHYLDRRMLNMELSGKKPRGRAKRGFVDEGKDDMKLAAVKNAEDWVRWKQLICFGGA